MKINNAFVILLSSLALIQGCASKPTPEESKEAVAKVEALNEKRADEAAAKKANYIKAKAIMAEERDQAAAERIKLSTTYKDANGKIIYYKAETDPAYKGGADEMRKYLKDNLKYPADALINGIEGTVYVDFIISEKGIVTNVVASDVAGENVDFTFKEESVRVVSSMPGWTAGLQQGKPVDTYFSIPITFEID